jgi:hypothetical protein
MNRYVTTLFFINALSRIGLSNQVSGLRSASYAAHLLAPDIYAETLIGGSEIYDARDPSTPFTRAYYEQHKYGTAWALGDTGQYFGLTLLFLHVALAVIHTAVLCWTKRSSAAWDSINELVILAYNSATKPDAFVNSSSGVEYSRTLLRRVRIGTRVLGNGSVQAELVVDGDVGAGDIVPGVAYS